jgi:hypothetical protein
LFEQKPKIKLTIIGSWKPLNQLLQQSAKNVSGGNCTRSPYKTDLSKSGQEVSRDVSDGCNIEYYSIAKLGI